MNRNLRRIVEHECGYSLVELLVAIVVFALLVLTIDVVFATVNRSSRTAELAADVAQNGRVAIERLTREIRFSGSTASEIRPWPLQNSDLVAFKSARLSSDPTVFCLNAPNTTPPDPLWNAACSPPEPGTYRPVWQAWIVYWLDDADPDNPVLRRSRQECAAGSQCSAGPTLPPPGGDVIATSVSSFSVSLCDPAAGPCPPEDPQGLLRVTLEVRTTEKDRVQGAAVPTQRIRLEGRTYIRN